MNGILAHPLVPFLFYKMGVRFNPYENTYTFTFKYNYGEAGQDGDVLVKGWRGPRPAKISIAPNQPISTSVFEEAIVLEYNGALTPEGMKEYEAPFIKEGDPKPITCFTSCLW